MVKQTDIIKRFLIHYTHEDLSSLYNEAMEVQVNVAKDNGERIEGDYKGRKWTGWTDGIETWKSFRIPRYANTEPEYDLEKELSWNLEKHVEGIGMTGWNWITRTSQWVAFDFDAIIGHSDKHNKKLSSDELKKIEEIVKEIPWVTLRCSTSGKGLHLYVFLNNVPTQNHTEHAALARAILGSLSAITGYDFQSRVDICGGNMWIWHRKMKGTNGLSLIKKGTILEEIPLNWRDHIGVVSGKKKKAIPSFITDSGVQDVQDLFDELSGQRSRIKLDDTHQQLIKYLQDTGAAWWWDQDHNMIVCHTYDLKKAHEELGFKGTFDTIATGKEHGIDHNCFGYPLKNGGWVIRRYTPGVKEHDSWDQDGSGWTRCYYNVQPDLRMAARSYNGLEDPDNGGFVFPQAELAEKAANMLGVSLDLPNHMIMRKTVLKESKDGRLSVSVEHQPTDPADHMKGWLPKKGQWKKLFNTKISDPVEQDIGNFDESVRHLVTESGENYGWVLKSDEQWRIEPMRHIQVYLEALGLNPKEINKILGSGIAKPWTIVNRPFQPEYIGDRKWNRKSAQLRFVPTQNLENLSYPNWSLILDHCGRSLNEELKNNAWARSNGIITGADYLKCWIASLIQAPTEPLPYLFLYGNQDSGKSILHEALSLLISTGIERADTALINQSGFNAEIEHAVLCVIEEIDLRRNNLAYNRIKDWVTSRQLPIHRKNQTPYTITNTTHWIQCANSRESCPVFPGDSRITVLYVEDLNPLEKIPKRQLIQNLEKEGPDFLASLVNLEIPPSNDRLNVPVIATQDKRLAEEANRSLLEIFLEEKTFYVTGRMISLNEFWLSFREWLDPTYADKWTKIRTGRELPRKHPKGRNPKDGQFYIGNISWTPIDPSEPVLPELVLDKDKLVSKQ